jgi:hypothetical protein
MGVVTSGDAVKKTKERRCADPVVALLDWRSQYNIRLGSKVECEHELWLWTLKIQYFSEVKVPILIKVHTLVE